MYFDKLILQKKIISPKNKSLVLKHLKHFFFNFSDLLMKYMRILYYFNPAWSLKDVLDMHRSDFKPNEWQNGQRFLRSQKFLVLICSLSCCYQQGTCVFQQFCLTLNYFSFFVVLENDYFTLSMRKQCILFKQSREAKRQECK